MIYSRLRFYVCCDNCGKTIEANAADEKIAAETAQREGWECVHMMKWKGTYCPPRYVNLCPKCKEEKK